MKRKSITAADFRLLAVRKNTHRITKRYCNKHGIKLHWFIAKAVEQYIQTLEVK